MRRDFYRAELTLLLTDSGASWALDLLDADGMSAATFTGPTLGDVELQARVWIATPKED